MYTLGLVMIGATVTGDQRMLQISKKRGLCELSNSLKIVS